MAMTADDSFADIARFYDAIMADIDYDRWIVIAGVLGELLGGERIRHLDIGCGTRVLMKKLARYGWSCVGIDLSFPMVRVGRGGQHTPPAAVADMRALPFAKSFSLVTCLFDSLNFLTGDDDLASAIREGGSVLDPKGFYYFDIITERMVTQHFEGQKWTEDNGGFQTTWKGTFDRKSLVAQTSIQVNRGAPSFMRERVYTVADVEAAVSAAGLHVLGAFDAETWKAPTKKSIRVDFVVAKTTKTTKEFEKTAERVRGMLAC